jgi:Uma2 family endonuclease
MRHGAPEAGIVDLQDNELHIFRSPQDGKYQDQHTVKSPGIMRISTIPGGEVDLSSLLAD